MTTPRTVDHEPEQRSDTHDDLVKEIKKQIVEAFNAAEKTKKPKIQELFNDVYDELPYNLKQQKDELQNIISKYPKYFNIDEYEK